MRGRRARRGFGQQLVIALQGLFELSSETRSIPVTVDGGRIQYKDAFGTRVIVFEGNNITATAEDNIDVWEKVE